MPQSLDFHQSIRSTPAGDVADSRDLSWKSGMPMMMRGGLRNLIRAAERRDAIPLTSVRSR